MSAPEGTQPGVGGLLTRAAGTWPEHPAVLETGTGRGLSYRQVDAAAHAQARRLAEAGVEPGDRVGLRLPTSVDFVVAFFGALRAGAIVVPLSPQVPGPELAKLLEHSGAKVVVQRDADEDLPDGVSGLTPVGDPDGGGEFADAGRSGEDIAVVSYTSGTTGPPRGVMLSHRALLANLEQIGAVEGVLEHDDRVLITIPLFHVYGLGPGLLQATAVGATAVLSERFEAQRTLDDCAGHGVTSITGVPTMYGEFAALGADELRRGLATVRRMTSGAAPLHPKVLTAIREATGLDVYEGYGLTECAPVVTSTLVTGYPKPGSVGRPLPGIELRLVDSDGTDQAVPLDPDDVDDVFEADGETGLVSIRGANLFSGYWPDGGHGPDDEGWFRTGDVGYLDTDGDLHLVDRANDLIIVNGFNVFPREVEEVIGQLPEVAEAAVVGVVDERSGEAVKAVVVPATGAALSEQQVADHCAAHLAGYKVPHLVEFAESLPHSATGKLRRLRLR
ncbi:long-chain acyl-CoA synthetase [Amycolatopsis mediterranei S699]|uniref:Long-chain acyl-CoA synthetase n=3 Tax=Amycolatopsis mediterranei TaxID=33910 RepID=A0A0H3CUL1_AMYMU|nr:long-chain fatty acid--CoA ligase [Amycolatopsis mediterranei]ADJ42297.1 long-chain acyl-CoA synthetase [Amycolatopsis mediterranei U32]AEK38981.1 long-chain acyl-CoA synthetase [Amycolatopsis mediterranei S699]AFO74011.1 long-chain acyl-CoA synthetase [Amycolatopsis mediterranei S699]AGT81140.1 long-chain acyl-CoA synthetase [Amycolatopsis mediterranei RB]KDO09795.1 acyl-CoA synthetase [Amycolatopsis mediterranei]